MSDQNIYSKSESNRVLDPVNPSDSGSMNDRNTFVNLDQRPESIPWPQMIMIGVVAGIGVYVAQRLGFFRNPFVKKLLVSKAAQKAINTYFDRTKVLH